MDFGNLAKSSPELMKFKTLSLKKLYETSVLFFCFYLLKLIIDKLKKPCRKIVSLFAKSNEVVHHFFSERNSIPLLIKDFTNIFETYFFLNGKNIFYVSNI